MKCLDCSHEIMTRDFCDYCAVSLDFWETRVLCESDKRSASVLKFIKEPLNEA